jgi:TonB family protein
MEMRKTLALSVFMHFILLSAALFLLKGSRTLHNEEIFFVRLAEDITKADAVKEEAARPGSDVHQGPPLTAIKRRNLNPAREPAQKKFSANKGIAGERPDIPAYQEDMDVTHAEGREKPENNGSLRGGTETDDPDKDGLIGQQTVQDVYHDASYSGDKKVTGNEGEQGSLPTGVLELIGSAIERVKVYPVLARKRGIEGTVYVSFRIDYDGEPEGISILRSSGFGILDAATVDVVRKAAPFPRVERRVEIPVTYRLKD